MKLERGEVAIVAVQFAALVLVVILLSTYSPGQSAQSTPSVTSVYWGSSNQGTALQSAKLTVVKQNESVITAYFTVAFSTQVSGVSGSRLCTAANTTSGVSTTYTTIPYVYDKSKGQGTMSLTPTGQQVGWMCTYTIKVTDSLSQTVTWLGSVELNG